MSGDELLRAGVEALHLSACGDESCGDVMADEIGARACNFEGMREDVAVILAAIREAIWADESVDILAALIRSEERRRIEAEVREQVAQEIEAHDCVPGAPDAQRMVCCAQKRQDAAIARGGAQ